MKGQTTKRIADIIAAAQPNPNLMSRATRPLDIERQKAREQTIYSKITMKDPETQQPIENIQQLNALINHLDKIYNLEALLPTGSMGNGGEVERILSNDPYNYNLKLRGKNKFTEREQQDIIKRLKNLADQAFQHLLTDPEIKARLAEGISEEAAKKLWPKILAYMSVLQVTKDTKEVTFFMNKTWEGSEGVKSIYDGVLEGKELVIVRMHTFLENLMGSKRTTKERKQVLTFKRDQNDSRQVKNIIGIEIHPNFNDLTNKAFDDFYDFARDQGILENDVSTDTRNDLGSGTISPMDVNQQQWKNDVFTVVRQVLLKKGLPLTDKELDEILDQYDVANQIALGRSISNLRGFMGELRAIILTHLLFPKDTGSLAGTSKVILEHSNKKGEAPLDVVIDLLDQVYGIQVKNISDLESYAWGNMRDKRGMGISSFYAERLQSFLDNQEINFFGAYVYNQPVTKDIPYEDLYAGFEDTFYDRFEPVYKKLALYIIRQTTDIKSSDNPLLSGTLTNDLFFMNNKIIPASILMQALQDNSDMITSTFRIDKPAIGFYRSGAKMPEDYSSYTNKAFIRYQVEIQYKRLLESAYSIS